MLPSVFNFVVIYKVIKTSCELTNFFFIVLFNLMIKIYIILNTENIHIYFKHEFDFCNFAIFRQIY